MNTLETLVPPLAECEKIPQGSFPDSFAIHVRYSYHRERKKVSEILVPRDSLYMGPVPPTLCEMYPAPTLEEIAQGTPGKIMVNFEDRVVVACNWRFDGSPAYEHWAKNENAATAALRLWRRINEKRGIDEQHD